MVVDLLRIKYFGLAPAYRTLWKAVDENRDLLLEVVPYIEDWPRMQIRDRPGE